MLVSTFIVYNLIFCLHTFDWVYTMLIRCAFHSSPSTVRDIFFFQARAPHYNIMAESCSGKKCRKLQRTKHSNLHSTELRIRFSYFLSIPIAKQAFPWNFHGFISSFHLYLVSFYTRTTWLNVFKVWYLSSRNNWNFHAHNLFCVHDDRARYDFGGVNVFFFSRKKILR